MALSLGEAGIADNPTEDTSSENEYLICASAPGVSICMHLDAIDGIAHDVIEGVKSLPRRGAEIGGLLLGRVTRGDEAQVTVERYQRLECEHRFGPQFALEPAELDNIEAAAAARAQDEELTVLGYYRSNTRPEFQLEASDAEILDRYFPDPGDLTLLIQPFDSREIRAQFLMRNDEREWQPAGDEFAFRGRVVGPMADTEPDVEPAPEPEPAPPPERPRRLVPDFMPVGEAPPSAPMEPLPERRVADVDTHASEAPSPLRRWWPFAGAIALVGGGLFFLYQSQRADRVDAPAATAPVETAAGPVRPLGLYADSSSDSWRISWNANASALQNARNVALFVREGDDQNRIDLSPADLQNGTYQYQPKPGSSANRDVTFRLEVTDAAGHLSAESFRMVQTVAAVPKAVTPAAPKPAPAAQPRPVKKVPPVVPASIRPRIRSSIPVDVRVSIDERGRVTSAVTTAKTRDGLRSFLAGRAVAAAKQWRFEPGPATEIIHFVFER